LIRLRQNKLRTSPCFNIKKIHIYGRPIVLTAKADIQSIREHIYWITALAKITVSLAISFPTAIVTVKKTFRLRTVFSTTTYTNLRYFETYFGKAV
jgi:hypothetical protein